MLFRNASLLVSLGLSFLPSRVLAFSDTQNYWGKDCIQQLGERKLLTGYPDGSFRPNSTVTRAEAAVLMLNAFPNAAIKRDSVIFKDVSSNYWGYKAINTAYQKGFFSGYPGNLFQPNQAIPRAQIIGVIAGGKNYSSVSNSVQILQRYFEDANLIPNYAQNSIAAGTINSIVVNYPDVKKLKPQDTATRGEVAALMCRALNIYAVPPQYIAGVEVQPQEVRALPGKLDSIPTFNSNSPELVDTDGILLSTFSPEGKKSQEAHLNYPFQGRFDVFSHHIIRAENTSQNRTVYQGIIVHNPGNEAVTLEVLQAASYLSREAPFINLPDMVDNAQSTVYAGPGSRTMNDVLRGVKQEMFPEKLVIKPGESQILANLPIGVQAPSSNGRTVMMRLSSNKPIFMANLAMKSQSPPTLAEWLQLLDSGSLAGKRDPIPTPLDPPREPTVFSRVAGVSQGTKWEANITDNPNVANLSLPQPGKAFSYPLGTVHLITLSTGQIQSAEMLKRYNDTAYFAHSNYGVEYNLTLPLYNSSSQTRTVSVLIQTPVKDEGGTDRLLFLKPPVEQIFFRGTVRVRYRDDNGGEKTRYVHLVQRRGQRGEALVRLNLAPGEKRQVQVDFLYPPDSTPPQVLTVKTEG
ncbi:DUF3370 family protein [Anabaena cylindrica FACHB-243]|uniref:S-layer domain-containing protein n=1 Tax=Anabaena cylindrica (strain ATCC 27899 / PCC 7122) TaxID=272123 RepID=K9ZPG1_ANACC|nr:MULTISPECIES: DUF3370 family protein [Anabaena]AFZ60195.1 S-layer domain-containing protein [Anabaena cylindrica PCC 7122]MBD2417752.1 DUF3370 family protein [Anabaena cylindrica FACHB-243]MBY5282618.1 DUF3370 family protein [Anabaena sp. CCAP 1446/1C]MBY5310492.1 DUF3370 family protein [Anabaena sp. CCAP 1446/1C]MCM2404667.1 DUF3370 family protein [Anabaena sp. CCAP 1446/1C]